MIAIETRYYNSSVVINREVCLFYCSFKRDTNLIVTSSRDYEH